jgi:hypothetical protein
MLSVQYRVAKSYGNKDTLYWIRQHCTKLDIFNNNNNNLTANGLSPGGTGYNACT